MHYYAMQYIQGHGLDVILDDLRRLRAGAAGTARRRIADGRTTRARWRWRGRCLTGRFASSRPGSEIAARDGDDGPATASAVRAASCPTEPRPAGGHRLGAVAARPSRATTAPWPGWAVQVAEALAHAHGQGVLHRDIKPSNLLLDVDGHVWVTDFGLAKVEGSDGPTQTGDIVGTLRYMAPERFEGWSDRRSDIYGLGMTLYELLTLRPAFEAATRAKLIEQVIHDPPPPPRKHDPQDPARPGDDRPEGDRQGAGGAVRDGRGTGGRPGELPGGQADRGAAERLAGAGLAVVPAEPGGGGVAGGQRRRGAGAGRVWRQS